MKISISATTDIGNGRENNEDAFAFCPDLEKQQWQLTDTCGYLPLGSLGTLIAVADGMGGTNAGEVAAATAIDTIRKTFTKEAARQASTPAQISELLSQVVKTADEAIDKQMCDHPETIGMGTTIVICWIREGKAYVAWCGDSRCYIYNSANGLQPLTKDHSYVQELIDKGEISEEEAFRHPDNNVITRGLGDFDTQVQPDIVTTTANTGDTFLLCTDGLCGYCTKEQISQVLADSHTDTTVSAQRLLDMALSSGSEDNICIAVATLLNDEEVPHTCIFKRLMKGLFGVG